MLKKLGLTVMLLVLTLGVPARAADEGLTAEDIVTKIHDKFMGWNFKTMTYDEIRVTSAKVKPGGTGGVMPLNTENATTMKLRYFYKAPNNHGYKLLSDPINDYWIGSPNQPGAIPMDYQWKDKIMKMYSVSRTDENQIYRDRDCYVVTLVPVEGQPAKYPMTWYVDSENYNVLKFVFLFTYGDRKMHTTGEVYYDEFQGYLLPAEAHWKTTVTRLPYIFMSSSTFSNYSFNVPLSDSVFEEEFPDDWFEKLNQMPYQEEKK